MGSWYIKKKCTIFRRFKNIFKYVYCVQILKSLIRIIFFNALTYLYNFVNNVNFFCIGLVQRHTQLREMLNAASLGHGHGRQTRIFFHIISSSHKKNSWITNRLSFTVINKLTPLSILCIYISEVLQCDVSKTSNSSFDEHNNLHKHTHHTHINFFDMIWYVTIYHNSPLVYWAHFNI